jgi:hypothetical protein
MRLKFQENEEVCSGQGEVGLKTAKMSGEQVKIRTYVRR